MGCIGCRAFTSDQDACDRHERLCKEVFVCLGSCSTHFGSDKDLQHHVEHNSGSCTVRACIGCRSLFSGDEAVALHEDSCEEVFKCPGMYCGKKFANERDLNSHVEQGTCNVRPCVGCRRLCESREACARHERQCTRVLLCPGGCGRGFSKIDDLQRHLEETPACGRLLCPLCGEYVPEKMSRADHVRVCRGSSGSGQDACFRHRGGPRPMGRRFSCPTTRVVADIEPELDARYKDVLRGIDSELTGLGRSSLKKKLRDLQLKWHPDKNPGELEKAQVVFQHIQGVWERNFKQ